MGFHDNMVNQISLFIVHPKIKYLSFNKEGSVCV
jgi:hypothetical protein